MRMPVALGAVVLWCGVGAGAQMVSPNTPPPARGSMRLEVTPRPLLSIESLDFLLGTWTADAGEHAVPMGSYAFTRELDGKIIARHSTTDMQCANPGSAACAHRDLLYVYQDSPGAPLKAVYFDSEGHVIQYTVDIHRAGTAYGQRDYAVFLSDVSALGPQYRLTYERNTDTYTKKTAMTGVFEQLLPNGKWQKLVEWGGGLVGEK